MTVSAATLDTRELTARIGTEIRTDTEILLSDPDSSRLLTRTKLAGEEPFV